MKLEEVKLNMGNRSIFPMAIDTFTEMYDLPPSLVSKAKRMQELKMQPSLSSIEQEELVQLVKDLGQYMVTPENFNKFQDALTNIESFLLNELDGYIEDKQSEWSSMITNFSLKGEYDSAKQYYFQNMVTYNGSLYICKADAKGKTPTNTSYWEKISEKGDKGDVGLGAIYKGEYVATTSYVIGDAVSYNGSIYYCKLASKGILPTNTTNWYCFDKHSVGETQPASVQNGVVWIKTF